MIEIPEAATLARQITDRAAGRCVARVVAGASPHKWAWFHGDPNAYGELLEGRSFGAAESRGGFVDVRVDDARLVFAEGVVLRLHAPTEPRPAKHQLLVDFHDDWSLSASVRMYGGLWAFETGGFDNPYYELAKAKPSPLGNAFDQHYFDELLEAPGVARLSVKAALATEQRVPGLGNGVLQDILFNARLHPKRKVGTLSAAEAERLFAAVKATLDEMTASGGRDTEIDLLGKAGGYRTKLSRFTLGEPCTRCATPIRKSQYLGGTVYFCPACQLS